MKSGGGWVEDFFERFDGESMGHFFGLESVEFIFIWSSTRWEINLKYFF